MAKKQKDNFFERVANFLFEVGTMRKLPRMHRQTLLTDDISDTIASHSYRVALIAWLLAKKEGADPYKAVMMGLLHDLSEARSGDHNWLHKRYIKIFEEEIHEEQLGTLPFSDLKEITAEYEKRKSKEAIIAKQADLLDQILLLREYEWQGNKEAAIWLHGNSKKNDKEGRARLDRLILPTSRKLGETIYKTDPSAWWQGLWTSKNR